MLLQSLFSILYFRSLLNHFSRCTSNNCTSWYILCHNRASCNNSTLPTRTPSKITAFAPINTSSSIITGEALGVQSHLLILRQPLHVHFTSCSTTTEVAFISIIVPSPTTAPILIVAPIITTAPSSIIACSLINAPGSIRAFVFVKSLMEWQNCDDPFQFLYLRSDYHMLRKRFPIICFTKDYFRLF